MKALTINRTSKKDRKRERERSIKDKRLLKLNPDLHGCVPYFDNSFSNVGGFLVPPKSCRPAPEKGGPKSQESKSKNTKRETGSKRTFST